MRVRVEDAATQAGVPQASITAFFSVPVALPAGDRASERMRHAATDDDGIAVLEGIPYAIDLTVRVGAVGYVVREVELRGQAAVPGATAETPAELEVRLVRHLPSERASARIRIQWQGVEQGAAPGGPYKIIVDDPGSVSGVIEPGGSWFISADPDGIAERMLKVRVVGPGHAGPWRQIRARRGHDVSIDETAPVLRPIRLRILDLADRPIGGARLRVGPTTAGAFYGSHSTIHAVTDPQGWAELKVVPGEEIAVQVQAVGFHFPDAERRFVPLAGRAYLLRGARQAPVRLSVVGRTALAPTARIEWAAVQVAPAIATSWAAVATDVQVHQREELHRRSLAREVPVRGSGDRAGLVRFRVLPGQYRLRLRIGSLVSEEFPLTVPPSGTEVAVNLEEQSSFRLRVEWEGEPAKWPILNAAVIPRRAGWADRLAIIEALGRGWRADTLLGNYEHMDPENLDHATALLGLRLVSLRVLGWEVRYDLGFLHRAGHVELEGGRPAVVTIMRGDWSVAIVPVRAAAAGAGVVTLRETDFSDVLIRLIDADGHPVADALVFPGVPDDLHVGQRQLTTYKKTNAQGAVSIGLAPGESGAVHVRNAKIRQVRSEPEPLAELRESVDGRRQYVLLQASADSPRGRVQIVLEAGR